MPLVEDQRNKPRELITFKDNRSNFGKKRTGERVGDHILVGVIDNGNYYAIFGIDGKLLINCSFESYNACFSVALLINYLFDPYMPILEVFPTADVISLAKWSVEKGLEVYEFTKLLEEQWRLSDSRVDELWEKAHQEAKKWGYEHIR